MDRRKRKRPEDLSRPESEAGIIATLIQHPDYAFYAEYLKREHFHNFQNQIIYGALYGMAVDNIQTVDTYGIQEYINKNDPENADEISKDEIDELISMSEMLARHSPKDYKILVSNVYDFAFRREMLKKLYECEEIISDKSDEDVRKRVYDAVDSVMTSYSMNEEVELFSSKIDRLWGEIEDRQEFGYSGIPFKFPALNDYVTIERGELVIFGAQQKVGKSIMLLNCAVDLLQKGKSVFYIDSELSDRLFLARMIANLSGVKYKNLTSGRYSEEERRRIDYAKEWLKLQPFQHMYMPIFSDDGIYTAVKRMNHLMPIDVLVIDYFKSTGNDMDAFQTYAAMGKIVDCVKNELAGGLNIAAIGAAQATATNKLADSAKIARNASTVIMLVDKTPEEIEIDGAECGNKKMIVAVNRNGMQHADGEYIDLMFNGDIISYEQAQRQHIPQEPY